MIAASKKLPCNHIFHTVCLRSWFQRQQTCPTCRLNILRSASGNADGRQREQAQGEVPTSQSIQAPTINHQGMDTVTRLSSADQTFELIDQAFFFS